MKLESRVTSRFNRADLQRLARSARPRFWERVDPFYVSLGAGFAVGALIVLVLRVLQ